MDAGTNQASRPRRRRAALNQAHWQALLDTARDAIVSIDDSGAITLFNRSAEAIFGYAADEVLGQNVTLLMPAPVAAEHGNHIRRYQDTGVATALGRIREATARRKDGTLFPIELSLSTAHRDKHAVYLAIIRDISERRSGEAALRRERDLAERLIETAQAIVLVLDTDGRIVRFNSHMEEISGYRLSDVQGKDWLSTLLPRRDHARIREQFARAARGIPIRGYVNSTVTRAGAERDIEWYASALRDDSGNVSGVICVGQDITERRHAEGELRALQKQAHQRERLADIGALTGEIIHHLGSPLAALSMQAQLILRRAKRDPEQPVRAMLPVVERIVDEAQRLNALIGEFMAFSREQRLNLANIALQELLGEVVETWEPLAAQRAITLALEADDARACVRGDADKLRRVFDNLVRNAVEAIEPGAGRVGIHVTLPTPEKVRIAVEDTGSGIAESVQVFRLFETTKPNGTGLGLAIARQIVLAHGGNIEFQPAQPHGTVFHVELPRCGPLT